MPAAKALRNAATNASRTVKILMRPVGRALGSRNYRPTILLSRSRSGSTLLLDMLNQHPRVDLHGEALGRVHSRSARSLVDQVFGRYVPTVRVAGFKVFYDHPLDDDTGQLWDRLAEMDDLHVLHLRRENLLRCELSLKRAEITGVWGLRQDGSAGPVDPGPVHLDPDQLRDAFEQTRNDQTHALGRLADKALLEITYEELTQESPATFRRITDFLGLRPAMPKVRLRKLGGPSLREAIANYGPLKDHFAGTEWSRFFSQ